MTDTKFPADIIHAAQASMLTTGCPASLTLAQWALESAWGKQLAAKNNYFGIKWFKGCRFPAEVKSTHESYHGKDVVIKAPFVAFPTLQDAFDYHGRLLTNPHGPYRDALPVIHDAFKFMQRIAHIYATDPSYEQKLRSIMSKHNLTQYDTKAAAKPATPPQAKSPAPAQSEPSKTETSK